MQFITLGIGTPSTIAGFILFGLLPPGTVVTAGVSSLVVSSIHVPGTGMVLSDMVSEVFRRLRESSDTPVFWSEVDIKEALNDGYMELSDETEWYEKYQTVDLLDNQPYYDARTLFRHPFLRIGAAYNLTTSRWLIPSSFSELDRGDRRWQSRVAEPDRFFVRGLWWLAYWPVKATASGKIKQYYRALPPLLVEDDDEPGFHNLYHYALVEYALADLFAQDGEVDLSWAAFKEFMRYEAMMTGKTQGRNKTPLKHGHDVEVTGDR